MTKKKSEPKARPRLGASYLGASYAATILSPVTHAALAAGPAAYYTTSTGTTALARFGTLKEVATAIRTNPYPYATNAALTLADVVIDKKTGQAAALSRGSLTAWAPEAYLAARALDDARNRTALWAIHARTIMRRNGYWPHGNWSAYGDPQFRTYRAIRHGGQALRLFLNRTSLGQMVKRKALTPVLQMVGGSV